MIRRSAVVAFMGVVMLCSPAFAQHRGLHLGDRVKVIHQYEVPAGHYPSERYPVLRERTTTGRLESRDSTELILSHGGGTPTHIRLVDVQQLGLSAGRSKDRGGLVGAFVGAIGGFAITFAAELATKESDEPVSGGTYAAGALGGAAVGWVTGYLVGRESWEDIPPSVLFHEDGDASLVPAGDDRR